jgi:hypothetical protein
MSEVEALASCRRTILHPRRAPPPRAPRSARARALLTCAATAPQIHSARCRAATSPNSTIPRRCPAPAIVNQPMTMPDRVTAGNRLLVTTLLPRTRDFPGPKRVVKCHRESGELGRNPAEARDVVRVSDYTQARFRRPLLYPAETRTSDARTVEEAGAPRRRHTGAVRHRGGGRHSGFPSGGPLARLGVHFRGSLQRS